MNPLDLTDDFVAGIWVLGGWMIAVFVVALTVLLHLGHWLAKRAAPRADRALRQLRAEHYDDGDFDDSLTSRGPEQC